MCLHTTLRSGTPCTCCSMQIRLAMYVYAHTSIYLYIYRSIWSDKYISDHLSIYRSIDRSIYLYLNAQLFIGYSCIYSAFKYGFSPSLALSCSFGLCLPIYPFEWRIIFTYVQPYTFVSLICLEKSRGTYVYVTIKLLVQMIRTYI